MSPRAAIFTCLSVLFGAAILHAAQIRYDNVLYLDKTNQPALYLKALHGAPMTASRDSQKTISHLAEGQVVEIIGLGENQHYVSAHIGTDTARGWVDSQALEAPPAELLDRLRARLEQAQAHRDAIARHEVVAGMTQAEVRASLGKPDRTSRLRTQQIDGEQWLYTTYAYSPSYTQYNDELGRPRHRVSYRREVSGHKVVTFQHDRVVEIADDKREESPSPSATGVLPAQPDN